MSAHGFRAAEDGHVVLLHTPQSGTANSDIFSMAEHHHASIVFAIGSVMNTALTLTLRRSDDFSSSNTTAIDFKWYKVVSGLGGDVPGAIQSAAAASGLVIASGSTDAVYVIEVDGQQMNEDAKNLVLIASASINSVTSAFAILSGARYAEDQAPTVTA